MTRGHTIHLGTINGVNNRPRGAEPYHSMAHAIVSGIAMAGFMGAAILWLAAL